MKIIAIIEALLLIAAAVGGGLYYRSATATCDSQLAVITKTEADLASTKGDLQKTKDELSSTKATLATTAAELSQARAALANTAAELDQMKANVTGTAADLTQAKATLAGTTAELAQARAKLDETTKASAESSKQRDAVAGLLSRDAALQQLDVDFLAAADRYLKVVQTMTTVPTAAQFADLKARVESLRDLAARGEQAATDADGFIEANGGSLASQLETVEKLRSYLQRRGKQFAQQKASADRTLASFREVTFGVYANQEWQSSDLSAAEGEYIAIVASGTWTWAVNIGKPVGAEGEDREAQYRLVPNVGNGALLARVHGSETIHPGFKGFEAERGGKVEFRINDSLVQDNKGTINVTMWAFRPME